MIRLRLVLTGHEPQPYGRYLPEIALPTDHAQRPEARGCGLGLPEAGS
jgi:hypothetical protein